MSSNLKIGIIIYIILIIQGAITGTALYIKAKKTAELYTLLLCHIAIVLWLLLATIENFSVGTNFFIIAIRLTLIPIMFIGSLLMIFTLHYVGIITPKNNKIIWLILATPIICYLPLLTNTYLELVIYKTIKNQMVTQWGVLFFVNTAISHIYFLLSGIIIIYKSIQMNIRVKQNIVLVLSVMVSTTLNILTGTQVIKSPGFDVVPVSFSIVLAVMSLLVFKYKIIDIVPIAYNELFNQINSAALIVDREGNIDEYNCIFVDYFNHLFNPRLCTNVYSFLDFINEHSDEKPNIIKIKEFLDSEDGHAYEDTIRINSPDSSIKQYTISIVSLKTSNRNTIGKLIVIKDVTEYRTVTISDERSRLSSELHDSLGNCINIISSNLEYALKNFDGSSEIKECIEISYAKSTSAFLHLRRIVEELKPIDIEKNGLLWALQSMFYKLRMKGIHIEFSPNNVDDKLISSKKHGEAIYFICQEAINNSVIHGRAASIIITLIQTKHQIKLYITDDGAGCNVIVKNKGLNSMESRINALGGNLEYGSPSEGGFNLKAVIPLVFEITDANFNEEVE